MPNLQDYDRLYRRKLRATGDSAAVVRLQTKPVASKTHRTLTHVTVENEDNAFTNLRIGIHNRGEDYYLDELDAPGAGELAVSRSDILLADGDRFFCELTGTTDDDSIIMNLFGWSRNF